MSFPVTIWISVFLWFGLRGGYLLLGQFVAMELFSAFLVIGGKYQLSQMLYRSVVGCGEILRLGGSQVAG